jgi:pilus assembly protein CpaE
MRDVTRIVLVDPSAESRNGLRRLLGGISTAWVAEVFETYQDIAGRIQEIRPDMTIVALDHDANRALELIQALSQSSPEAVVLPASRHCDSALILRAIRAGAREFFTLPGEPAELFEIVTRLLRGRQEDLTTTSRGPQIITVTGAAGGVGTTSVAMNLATTLAAAKEHETILLDLDLVFGSIDTALDIIPDNSLYTVIQNFERLDLTLLKRSLTRHGSGLYILPHPLSLEEAAKVDANALHRLLGLLKAAFTTVVIDTSKGLQATDFVALEMSDIILIVVQLELGCLRNSARLINFFQQYDGYADRIRLVVNRAGSRETEIGLKKAEETLKMPIAWQIPNANKVFQASRVKGMPIADIAKGCRAHEVFLEMARALRPPAEAESSKPRKGLFAAFF